MVSVLGAAEDGLKDVGFCGDEGLKREVDGGCHKEERGG